MIDLITSKVCRMKDTETQINLKQRRTAEGDSSDGRLMPGVDSSLLSPSEADSLVETDNGCK